MIEYLRGKVVSKGEKELILDVSGIGFRVFSVSRDLSLISEGEEVVLYVYLNYKGERLEIFGFLNRSDRDFFERLLSVAKIGTRVSFEVLERLSWNEFLEAVEREDVGLLSSIPKVGEKRAKRMIFELKGELLKGESVYSEVKDALLKLGYTEKEANTAILKIAKEGNKSKGVEELLKEALLVLRRES